MAITLLLVVLPGALAYQFSVGPYGETTKTVNLYQGDIVTGNITASVPSGSLLPVMGALTITGPSDNLVLSQSITSSKLIPFHFQADKSGDYQITFSSINAFSYTQVNLEYTIPNHAMISFNFASNPMIVAIGASAFLLAIGGIFLVWHNNRNKSSKTKTSVSLSSMPASSAVIPPEVSASDEYPPVSKIKCGKCSTMNDLDSEFCKKCGNKFR